MKTKVKYISFPLCVLVLDVILKDLAAAAQSILYYWTYIRSKEITACCPNLGDLKVRPSDLDDCIKTMSTDRAKYEEAIKIVSVSITENIPVHSIAGVKEGYKKVCGIISTFVEQTGAQPYCRISKEVLLKVSRGQFDNELFRILCAVKAIIGSRKPAMRITYDRIRFAMYGYKSKDAFANAQIKDKRVSEITDKMLRLRVRKLSAMKFFLTFTYNRKAVYYSTRFRSKKDIVNWLVEKKINKRKSELGIEDDTGSLFVKNSVEEVEEGYREILCAPDSKEQLRIMYSF